MSHHCLLTVFVVISHVRLLVGAAEAGRLDSLLGHLDFLLVGGTAGSAVNGTLVDLGVLGLVLRPRGSVYGALVLGAETLSVFTLSNVNGACVRVAMSIDLHVSVGVLGACRPAAWLVWFLSYVEYSVFHVGPSGYGCRGS